MSLWSRLFGATPPASDTGPDTGPRNDTDKALRLPQMPAALYAIGDVHGCLDQLINLEAKILADGAQIAGQKLVVVLGDVVDRGPKSAEVIDHLLAPMPVGWQRLVLKGNHEQMMLKFLRDPDAHQSWLKFGGAETLQSYGLAEDPELGFGLPAPRMTQMIATVVPSAHMQFLDQLPLCLEVGEFFLSHAGFDPAKSLADQTPHDLMWRNATQLDFSGGVVTAVHGHVPVAEAEHAPRRINLDTGAYASGVLTAARLTTADDITFFTARA